MGFNGSFEQEQTEAAEFIVLISVLSVPSCGFNLETAMEPAKYAKDTKREGFAEMCALTLRVNG